MYRLIKYSSNAYSRYKVLPIVLVVATKSLATSFEEKFVASPCGFLLEVSSVFWAKQFMLLNATAISRHFNETAINPISALGLFLTRHSLFKVLVRHRTNKKLLMLSSVVKEILNKNDQQKINKSGVLFQLNQAKSLLEEILEQAESQGESSSNKIRKCAEEGALFIREIQKDLEEEEDTTKDLEFIKKCSRPGKRKNWKKIFNQGKAQGLFHSYTSSDNLKSSYYQIQKRKNEKKVYC